MMSNNMRVYDDLKDMVEREIENIVKKDELDEKCLGWLDKLVDIAKDIDTIYAMHDYGNEDGGYSNRMYYPHYYNDGEMMPMTHGNSYMNRDSMGRYSRNSYAYRGNGYSREGNMRERLEQMMNEATTQQERDAINSALDRMM